jgi:hypothetical protein
MAGPVSEEAMRERRDELQSRLDELKEEQMGIQRELHAISLYLGALTDELPKFEAPQASKSKVKERRAPSGPRAPRGERRGNILDILKQRPEGHTFGGIIETMGVEDERERKAVYATLQNMKRKGEIMQDPNRHFVVAATQEQESGPAETEAGLVHDETSA